MSIYVAFAYDKSFCKYAERYAKKVPHQSAGGLFAWDDCSHRQAALGVAAPGVEISTLNIFILALFCFDYKP